MKLRNLFWFATGASISYHLVKNRHEMKSDVQETGQLVKGIQENLAKIQHNLDIIQEQKANLNELVNDFQYKAKLFSQQATLLESEAAGAAGATGVTVAAEL